MKILAIDTSTLTAGVAFLDGERLIERREKVTIHSERLLPIVDEVMREASVPASQLDAVACGAGPGSFTGLRIGLATAKGLCFATGRPLVLVSSLAALAARAPEGTRVCATIDAYKGEVYAGIFVVDGGEPRLQGDEQVLPPDALAAQLDSSTVMVGDGVIHYPALLDGRRLLDDDPSPRPGDLARLATLRRRRGEQDNLADAGPRYIRLSEPEILRMKRDKLKP
jgi:tRNA threonylcarbamoyladenosine biosynthesis protein TsaB